MKKIVSWNVNGIRACVKKGFLEYLNNDEPDILCVQEIKAAAKDFPADILNHKKYHVNFFSAKKAGYSGVATLSVEKPLSVTYGLGVEKYDDEGRCLITEYEDFFVMNSYFPNGQRDHNRVPFKLEYYERMLEVYNELLTKKDVFMVGDFNTAHTEIDLANPKGNCKTTGFLLEERDELSRYLADDMVDTLRHFHPDKEGLYTWWTYRNNCRERNIGWRIDYIMANQKLLSRIQDSLVRAEILGSDHCPVEVHFN